MLLLEMTVATISSVVMAMMKLEVESLQTGFLGNLV